MEKKQAKITNLMVNRDGVAARTDGPSRWTWGPEKVYHWTVTFVAFSYIMWRFATNEEKAFLLDQMKRAFIKSPYGLKEKQDTSNWGWQTTRYVMINTWKWYLLHPVLGRAMAHVAPSLVPVFYAAYSCLFVAFHLGWEVVLLYLGQHAVFYAAAALRIPALCYAVAAVVHLQKFVNPFEAVIYMYERYGLMAYRVAYVAFHWNIMRGLSFSLDFVRAQRRSPENSQRRWPPYWKTLAYLVYLPTVYHGPPQNYDDFAIQLDKPRPELYSTRGRHSRGEAPAEWRPLPPDGTHGPFLLQLGDVQVALGGRTTGFVQPGGLRLFPAVLLLRALPVHLRLRRRPGPCRRNRDSASLHVYCHNVPLLPLLEVLRPRHAPVDSKVLLRASGGPEQECLSTAAGYRGRVLFHLGVAQYAQKRRHLVHAQRARHRPGGYHPRSAKARSSQELRETLPGVG
ncbi:uncharacterized protein LOC119458142 isoform X8 [Dermacentor silvarum]|uniref:uncharacterized protein LOC119458142 isoform X8 n=1 Tax=Dermacentor silvarum TaxID=543639 RepID=UPI002100E04D|nr:uncharacterized protein LOC119458142 isoform X8 [Dermacentor silvarum]